METKRGFGRPRSPKRVVYATTEMTAEEALKLNIFNLHLAKQHKERLDVELRKVKWRIQDLEKKIRNFEAP